MKSIKVILYNSSLPSSISEVSVCLLLAARINKWLWGMFCPLVGVSGILAAGMFLVRIEPHSYIPGPFTESHLLFSARFVRLVS